MKTTFTYIGHGTHAIQTADGYKLIIDPFFTHNPSTELTLDQIEADFVLVTHGHDDHIGDAIELTEKTNALCIAPFEVGEWLETQGVSRVHTQHIGGGFQHPFGYLKLTLALHGSRLPDGSDGGMPAGFLIKTNDGQKIYIAGDTGLFSDMALIGKGGIDLAVLPIGDNYTMGPDDALQAVKLLKPKFVIPCHYNTFSLIEQDSEAWGQRVIAETETTPYILNPGESISLE